MAQERGITRHGQDRHQARVRSLDQVAVLLEKNADLDLEIEDHTDDAGAKAADSTLSKSYAGGDNRPVADNASEEGRAQNRRVELVKR